MPPPLRDLQGQYILVSLMPKRRLQCQAIANITFLQIPPNGHPTQIQKNIPIPNGLEGPQYPYMPQVIMLGHHTSNLR